MQKASAKLGSVEARHDFGQHGCFRGAAFLVEPFELGGKIAGARGVAGGEELDDLGGNIHATCSVDARSEAEADVDGG